MEDALRLSEIRSHIGSFLDKSDLVQCMFVCRKWATDFRRLLWRELELSESEFETMNKDLLHKYGHLIRTLTIYDPMPLLHDWFAPPFCCNLVEINIRPSLRRNQELVSIWLESSVVSASYDQAVTFMSVDSVRKAFQLIKCNPGLRRLSEQWSTLSPMHTAIFKELLCQEKMALEELSTSYWKMSTTKDLHSLIDHDPQLRKLTLFRPTIGYTSTWITEEHMPGSTVTFHSSPKSLLLELGDISEFSMTGGRLIIPRSTNVSFEIHAHNVTRMSLAGFQGLFLEQQREPEPSSLVRQVTAWHCSKLTKLRLTQDEFDAVHTATALFVSAERLKDVEIQDCTMCSTVIRDLIARHAVALQRINLWGTIGLSGLDSQLILTSCPNLLHFGGSNSPLRGSDMVKEPWICRQLQTLSVILDMPTLETHVNDDADAGDDREDASQHLEARVAERQVLYRAIYDQLASLKQLQYIKFGGFSRGKVHATGIPWSLDAGLDRLRGLSKMETIFVTESLTEIGVEEAQWIKKHWPRLKRIRRLDDRSTVRAVDSAVQEILGSNIEVF
ncbi:hypothetical protein BGZ54_008152 [Gamsiella multidivaricata]|nr:hypothetical protein BGZ54_008152 [Gamsiella multidivaricata]